jgi:hypothetical protein
VSRSARVSTLRCRTNALAAFKLASIDIASPQADSSHLNPT